MSINKIIEKKYNGDAYLLEIIKDKVILNDDYEGIIVLDFDLSVEKKISVDQDLCIYNVIVIDEKNILLNCVEDKKIYIINIETDEVKSMEMPECICNEVIDKIITNNGDNIIVSTYKNNCFSLDVNQLIIKSCNDYVLENKFEDKKLDEVWIDYVKMEDKEIYLSEKQIKIVGSEEQYIYPDEDYYFCRLRVINRDNQKNLIVLSSDGYSEKYIITIYAFD